MTSLLLILAAAPVLAGQPAPAPDAATTPAGTEIVVTATRTPQPADRVSASLTALDKIAIDRNQDVAVSDLLQRTPGVSVSRNGGFGTATSLRIRGAESDQTVVVIDGVKLNDPSSTGGGYNFGNLLVGDAARIEVLRGPQSILWGSQAIGGVVNIVTATPTRPLEGSIDVETGNRETVNARAAIGGTTGPLDWRVGAQTFATDGVSAVSPRFGGVERDGYRNQSATGRATLTLAPGLALDVRGYYANGRVGIDGFGTPPDTAEASRNEEWLGYAGINLDLAGGRFRNRFAVTRTQTDRSNIDPTRAINPQTFDASGRNNRYEYQGSLAILPGVDATFGAEREEQRLATASPPNSLAAYPTTRGRASINSVYAQVTASPLPALTLNGGARYDDHSTFGGNAVVGGGAVWAPLGRLILFRANYGEGFKAPTLYQLYSEYGNQALAPERAHGWDAGAETRLLDEHLTIGASYFERTSRNLIVYLSCPTANRPAICYAPGSATATSPGTPRFGYYDNVSRAEARGIEGAGSFRFGGLLFDANYTWTASEDRSSGSANFGRQLARRPRHQASGSATYSWSGGLETGVALRWSGATFDNARTSAATVVNVNDSYTLVDLRADVPLAPGIRLFGRIENLFDERYETVRRYGQPGLTGYAGFRARF